MGFNDVSRIPKIIGSCGHTVCSSCLCRIIYTEGQPVSKSEIKIRCPHDNKEYQLSAQVRVDQFPTKEGIIAGKSERSASVIRSYTAVSPRPKMNTLHQFPQKTAIYISPKSPHTPASDPITNRRSTGTEQFPQRRISPISNFNPSSVREKSPFSLTHKPETRVNANFVSAPGLSLGWSAMNSRIATTAVTPRLKSRDQPRQPRLSPVPQWARSLVPEQPNQHKIPSPSPFKAETWPRTAAAAGVGKKTGISPCPITRCESSGLFSASNSQLSSSPRREADVFHRHFVPRLATEPRQTAAPHQSLLEGKQNRSREKRLEEELRTKPAGALLPQPRGVTETASTADLSVEQLCESMSDSFEERLFQKKVFALEMRTQRSTADSDPSSFSRSERERMEDLISTERRGSGDEMTNLELFMRRITM